MRGLAWCLLMLAAVAVLIALAPQPAVAQEAGQYVNVSELKPWTPETNFMSLEGYLRWMTFQEQRVWLSMPEARRIVAQQVGG